MALTKPAVPSSAVASRAALVVVAVVVALMPVILLSEYYMQIATLVLIYTGLTVALNICIGYAGLVSVAHGGVFGAGAYVTGVLMTDKGWSFWVTLPVSALVGAALGLLVGVLTLRLAGHYFVIASLGFGLLIYLVILNWTSVTGGATGVGPIDTYDSVLGIQFDSSGKIYYLVLVFVLVFMALMLATKHSALGRRLEAIRQNERLAAAVGIDPSRTRLIALTASAAIAAVAGSLYAPYIGFLDPSVAHLNVSFMIALALVIAGMRSVLGPLVAAIVHVVLPEALRGVEQFSLIVLGVVLLVVVKFAPNGLVGTIAAVGERVLDRHRDPASPAVDDPPEPSTATPTDSEAVGRA